MYERCSKIYLPKYPKITLVNIHYRIFASEKKVTMPEYELILQLLSVHMTSCLAVNLCCDVTA